MPAAPRTPSGSPLRDGYQMVITFASNATVALYEKTVTPPGLDNGESVDTTTMHNVDLETSAPQGLNKVTDGGMECAYDPAALTALLALVGVEDDLTYHFPDGSSWTDRGYLKKFTPNQVQRGTQPTATCVVASTCTDDVGAEEAPAYVAPA